MLTEANPGIQKGSESHPRELRSIKTIHFLHISDNDNVHYFECNREVRTPPDQLFMHMSDQEYFYKTYKGSTRIKSIEMDVHFDVDLLIQRLTETGFLFKM